MQLKQEDELGSLVLPLLLKCHCKRCCKDRPPNYVSADEQVTKLAARFQKEGAEDLWTEKDGPERFESLELEEEEEGYDYLPKVESGHRHGIKDQVVYLLECTKKTCW